MNYISQEREELNVLIMMDYQKLPHTVSFQPSRHETQDILQVNYPLMILDIIYMLLGC